MTLANIYNALKDGEANREDYFQLPKVAANEDQQDDGESKEAPKGKKKGEAKQVSINDL
jgi:hypothetical protein